MGDVYTAERILDQRQHNGITQYLIKWKGYAHRDSTWEPVENIIDRTLLINFQKQTQGNDNASSNSRQLQATTTAIAATSADSNHIVKRGRGRPRKLSNINNNNDNNNNNGHTNSNGTKPDKNKLAIFNPVTVDLVREPRFTQKPIIVTDVTAKNSTVTISECKTSEGFFRTPQV